MKKGIIRQIPLQADLCLNKQKVDIEDFKGWQKCNAPVYGGCLSPLYKMEDDHHDIFIGDDYYDWSEGALKKNGVTVLSGAGSKKIKKTRITEDYSAMSVSEDDILTWVKETSGSSIRFSLHGGTATDVTLTNCERIVSVKTFAKDNYTTYGVVAWFLRIDGAYGYFIAWSDDGTYRTSYGQSSPTIWNGFKVVSPLIQVGFMAQSKFLISFFGTSGANLSETSVKNVFVDGGSVYDNPTFKDSTLYDVLYGTYTSNVEIAVEVRTESLLFLDTNYSDANFKKMHYGIRQRVSIEIEPHSQDAKVDFRYATSGGDMASAETIVFPASNKTVLYERTIDYWDLSTGSVSQSGYNNYYELHILEDDTEIVNISDSGTGLRTPSPSDYTTASSIKIMPAYKTEQNNEQFGYRVYSKTATNINDTAAPLYAWVDTFKWVPMGANGFTVINYCSDAVTSSLTDASALTHEQFETRLANNRRTVNSVNNASVNVNYFYTGSYQINFQPPQSSAQVANVTFSAPYIITGYPRASNNGNQYFQSTPFNTSVYYQFYYKVAYENQSLKEVDCCMDDGKLYCVTAMASDENVALPRKKFALAGTFSSFDSSSKQVSYVSDATFDINYDEADAVNVFPKYYKGMNISLGNNYLRIVYLFKAKQGDTQYINILIDSLAVAEGEQPAHLYAGVESKSGGNAQGGVKNTNVNGAGFRFLFNNNLVSNIACYENKKYIGTIIADWFTVDDNFCPAFNSDTLYYRDNTNKIWKIELVNTGAEWDYRLIENRYIILNTVNYFNCYDTKTDKKRHWASDYNNRTIMGFAFTSYSNNEAFRSLLTSSLFTGLLITGQNANYEVTKDTITSLELGAILYNRVLTSQMSFISCGVPYGAEEGIDLYMAEGNSTSALYVCSYSNGIKYINKELVNPYAVYPIATNGNVRYNPNLFTRFISSYNNKDMVISDGIAYKLVYFNNVVPVMAYYLLDGVEELLDAFVLQSSYYGVSETRLYQMNYSNGVGVEVICDITNMEYLGALPTQALFWSAQNRAIYSFKGNCIMALAQYANDLEEIKNKWYNPATQELFLDTNIGLLVFSDLGTYCIEKTGEYEDSDIKDIFFYPDRFLVNLEDDTSHTYYWSYNPLEDYESNKVIFFTKYYGNTKTPVTVNNIYIRLYDQGIEDAEGTIKFKAHTITDIGTQTDQKTIAIGGETGEAWDELTNTMLVKYTPQYNRGLGFALECESTFPIIDIKYDYVEDGPVEAQLSHINI